MSRSLAAGRSEARRLDRTTPPTWASTLVQPLLDRGADPSRRDEEGKTPLDVAIDTHNHDIVEALRSRGVK